MTVGVEPMHKRKLDSKGGVNPPRGITKFTCNGYMHKVAYEGVGKTGQLYDLRRF